MSEEMTSVSESMTSERAVEQLRTLIEDAESHRDADGSLDQVFQDDIAALKFAIEAIEEAAATHEDYLINHLSDRNRSFEDIYSGKVFSRAD